MLRVGRRDRARGGEGKSPGGISPTALSEPGVSLSTHRNDEAGSGIVQSHVGYERADYCGAETTTDRGGLADGVVGTFIARMCAEAHHGRGAVFSVVPLAEADRLPVRR